MTVIELFAGAGGASLGLLRAGFTELRAVEWDASACATRRAAGLRCDEGDVRDLAHYEGVIADAVWSSFPCQAWSTAGKRLGKDDPRNGWPWTVDVLDQVKPRWFMAENVPGLTHHRGACNGRCADDCARLYFEQTILRELRERFAWVGYRILDAARFGVPQNRERLIIVAGPHAIGWPKETHAPPEDVSFFGPLSSWITLRQVVACQGDDPILHRPAPAVTGGSARAHINGRSAMSGNASTRRAMIAAGIQRYSVSDAALIQDFPVRYPFQGSTQSRFRQIGNAVPPTLAYVVANAVATTDR